MKPLPSLADLHRHLDGSMRMDTLVELARGCGVRLPEALRFEPGMGLAGALARFEATLSTLQQAAAVRRVAGEICEDAAREGVTTLEIRFAPQLHGGATTEAIVDAALEGASGRAGIVLCGLYGEDPVVLERLVAIGQTRPGVVGIDLAGGPAPGHRFALRDYADAFRAAAEAGLGRTVHAGEGRPAAEIRVAVEELGVQRIGHGTTLLNDPAVLALVIERDVTIEACPTSNMHTGVIHEVAAHPLVEWLRAGVRVCVCTDNTLLSDIDAPTEYRNVLGMPGGRAEDLETLAQYGHAAAFSR